MDELSKNLTCLAISEIANNVIKYGIRGKCELSIMNANQGLRVKISDEGPGIKNIYQSFKDSYTTHQNSLGIGIGAAQRAMDYFNIVSSKKGTVVTMEKYISSGKAQMVYSALSIPDDNYTLNGDGYYFKEYSNSLFIAIIDGLGEGQNAWHTTESLKKVIAKYSMLNFKLLMRLCENDIKTNYPNSGAAIAFIRIFPEVVFYLGIGDVFCKVFAQKNKTLSTKNGIVGAFPLPSLKTIRYELNSDSTIVLCTDGISDNFSSKNISIKRKPSEISSEIMDKYRRSYGDATIITTKINML